MLSFKWSFKFWIALIALILALILVGRVTWSWLNDGITLEDGTDPGIALDVMMCLALAVAASWLWSAAAMLRHCAAHGGSAYTLTAEGIEDALTCRIVLAFIFVLPVKCIPWEAVTYADAEVCYIRARRKNIRAGFLARTAVAVYGFQLSHAFMKPKMTREQFDTYVTPRLPVKPL